MKQKTFNIILTVVSVLLMCGVVVLAVMYAEGYYDFSFIDRSTEAPSTSEPPEDTTEEAADTEHQGDTTAPFDGTDTTDAQTGENTGELPEYDFDALHSAFENYSAYPGRAPTEALYDPAEHMLLRLTGLSLPEELYTGTYKKTTQNVTYDGYLRVFTDATSDYSRPSVDVYMGMLAVANGTSVSFYSGKGELLCRYEWREYMAPVENDGDTTGDEAAETRQTEYKKVIENELIYAYERDGDGNPLFIVNGEYFIIDKESKTLVRSDYNALDTRGIKYNYASAFGVYEGQFTAVRSGELFGILDTDGERLKRAIYSKAYNYSEGVGLVVYEGEMCYLNENGKVAVEGYYEVAANDEKAIGAVYYDGGYVRVRKIKTDIRGKVIQDSDTLIDKSGNEIVLPAGYGFVSYSNQRVLVNKRNLYGFYAVKGAWVADPVYSYATPYYEGLAVVGVRSGQKGVIDMDGNFVIPLSYSSISVCSGGIIVCFSAQTGYDVYVKTEYVAAQAEETAEQ